MSWSLLVRTLVLCLVGWWGFPVPSAQAAPTISAQLDRNEIMLGESARLTVTVTGGDDSWAQPPVVPGLDFVNVGQLSQTQIINGSISSSLQLIYELTPQHSGTFTIPAFAPGSQALTLKVRDAGNPVRGGASDDVPDEPNAASGRTPVQAPKTARPNSAGFIRVLLDKKELYVGESVPVDIQLGIRSDVVTEINVLPGLTGEAFTLGNLGAKASSETHEELSGLPYTILTWHGVLTALKAGQFPLGIESQVTGVVRSRPDPAEMDDDSLFQNFLGGLTKKQFTLKNEPENLTVLALPAEGRPGDFTGAIGNFTITSQLADPKVAVGDPVSLRVKIAGTGNFDRVNTPMLANSSSWKTYKPTAKFTPSDAPGLTGEKDFEQAVIPLSPGSVTLPPLTFSYFNPESRHYETHQTAPLALEVTGSVAVPPPDSSLAATTGGARQATSEWRPDHVDLAASTATLRPLYFRAWYLASQASLILGLAGLGWWSGRQHLSPARRRKMEQGEIRLRIDRAVATMAEAAGRQDSSTFFTAARTAFQERLAQKWGLNPSSITLAEIDRHLINEGGPIRQIFGLADQVVYSGQAMSSADLAQWLEIVHLELNRLEAS